MMLLMVQKPCEEYARKWLGHEHRVLHRRLDNSGSMRGSGVYIRSENGELVEDILLVIEVMM